MTLHGEQWQLIIWKSKRWVSMASIWRMYKLPVKEWEKRRVACEAKNAACEKSFPRRPSSLGASFCVHLTSPLSPSLTGTCWPLCYQFVPCALLPSLYSRELSTPLCVCLLNSASSVSVYLLDSGCGGCYHYHLPSQKRRFYQNGRGMDTKK